MKRFFNLLVLCAFMCMASSVTKAQVEPPAKICIEKIVNDHTAQYATMVVYNKTEAQSIVTTPAKTSVAIVNATTVTTNTLYAIVEHNRIGWCSMKKDIYNNEFKEEVWGLKIDLPPDTGCANS